MSISFDLPTEIERSLRAVFGNLNVAAKEAALVELYRQGQLMQHDLATSLGISRLDTEALLKRHGVTEDLPTAADIAQDIADLRRLLESP